jgi:uncharacterized protein
MTNAPSVSSLPRQLDPRKFAQQGIEISGSVAVDDLSRLGEILPSKEGVVHATLAFGIGEQRILHVVGHISANIENVCQRCLDPVPVSVECELSLAILWKEEDAERLPKAFEPWIVPEGRTDIYQIIEDELLLSLPIVVYHEEECVPHRYFSSGEEEVSKVAALAPSTNPFQALQQLKGSLQTTDTLTVSKKSVAEDKN